MAYRISVDTGGTFTDVVVVDDNGQLRIGKALTTPRRAFEGISAALDNVAPEFRLTASELLADTETFTYGTTRATNAIVEGKTARTAFFTTQGFPDILLLREGGKLDPFKQIPYPPPTCRASSPSRSPSASTLKGMSSFNSMRDLSGKPSRSAAIWMFRPSASACSGRSSTRRMSCALAN